MQPTLLASSWAAFESLLGPYFSLHGSRRGEFLFRGHGSMDWRLEPTLARFLRKSGIALTRQNPVSERLNAEFVSQAAAFLPSESFPAVPITIELLARHFGVPSKLLDWTRSPYVAAYFAVTTGERTDNCCIHVLDRAKGVESGLFGDAMQLVELPDYSLFNARATEQDAIAIRIEDVQEQLDTVLADSLFRIEIVSAARSEFLARLASMRITARTLFRSADHAAQTAISRVEMEFSS